MHREFYGLKHEVDGFSRRQKERVFPRLEVGELDRYEQQCWVHVGSTPSLGDNECWFHGYKGKEDPFHEVYTRHGGSNSLIVRFKKNLPSFDRFWHTEDLLSWIDAIEDFFEDIRPPEHLKCKIVWYKMNGAAYYWWKTLQNDRFSEGKNLISSWPTMKRLLLKRFMPANCSTNYLCSKQCAKSDYYSSSESYTTVPDYSIKLTQAAGSCVKQAEEEKKGIENCNEEDTLSKSPFNEQSIEMNEVEPTKCLIKVPTESNTDKHNGRPSDEKKIEQINGDKVDFGMAELFGREVPCVQLSKMIEHQVNEVMEAKENTKNVLKKDLQERFNHNKPMASNVITSAAAFDKILLDQLKETITGGWEIGAEHASTVAIVVWNDGSQARNASFDHKDVLKLGAYDVDFLIKEILMCNFDPGGKWPNEPSVDHGQSHPQVAFVGEQNFWPLLGDFIRIHVAFGTTLCLTTDHMALETPDSCLDIHLEIFLMMCVRKSSYLKLGEGMDCAMPMMGLGALHMAITILCDKKILIVLRQHSVIHSKANMGARGQVSTNLLRVGDVVDAQQLVLSLFYSLRVDHYSALQDPSQNRLVSDVTTELNGNREEFLLESSQPLDYCSVKSAITKGNIKCAVIYFHKAHTTLVHLFGVMITFRMVCAPNLGKVEKELMEWKYVEARAATSTGMKKFKTSIDLLAYYRDRVPLLKVQLGAWFNPTY